MDLQELFASNFKKIRLCQNISQEELGFRSGLHRTYISDIERKKEVYHSLILKKFRML